MTTEEIIKFLDKIEKGLKDSPSYDDPDACDEYFRKMRSAGGTLANIIGELERDYSIVTYNTIKNSSKEEYNRIKNSSTLALKYVEGANPELARLYHWSKTLMKVMQDSLGAMRTMIAFKREEMGMNMVMKNVI